MSGQNRCRWSESRQRWEHEIRPGVSAEACGHAFNDAGHAAVVDETIGSPVESGLYPLGEVKVARWLRAWVRQHGGTGLRDTGKSLVLECTGCSAELGISYGPTDKGDPEAEELAYFRHQAADLMAVLR